MVMYRSWEDRILRTILRANVDINAVEFNNLMPFRIEGIIRYKLRLKVFNGVVRDIIREFDVPFSKHVGYYNLAKAVDKAYRHFKGRALEVKIDKYKRAAKVHYDLDDHVMDVVVERVLKAMREYDVDRDAREIEVKQYVISRLEELKKIKELSPKGLIRINYKEYLGEEGGGEEDRDSGSSGVVGEAEKL